MDNEKLIDKDANRQARLSAEAEKVLKEMPSDRGVGVYCSICCDNTLSDNDFDARANPTAQEVFNHLEILAKERGWAYQFDGRNAQFICPICRKKKETALTAPLPPYKGKNKCSVCGYNRKISTRYCTGNNLSECRFGARPHLHRVCGRCGYSWVEGCLNDTVGKENANGEAKS